MWQKGNRTATLRQGAAPLLNPGISYAATPHTLYGPPWAAPGACAPLTWKRAMTVPSKSPKSPELQITLENGIFVARLNGERVDIAIPVAIQGLLKASRKAQATVIEKSASPEAQRRFAERSRKHLTGHLGNVGRADDRPINLTNLI